MLRKLAQVLSFGILAFQLYIPWSVPHLATQDGPAHVYTAFVTRDLVLHRHTSPYHQMYRVQKSLLPNWTCTLLLACYLGVFGPDHAEAFLMSICLLAGYGAFAYCLRVLQAGMPGALLLANWLLQSWFLWGGFYNFYLGMVLLPLIVGGYLRYQRRFDRLRAGLLAAALVVLFFTHLLPAAFALAILSVLALWLGFWQRDGWRPLLLLLAALCPAAVLILRYALQWRSAAIYHPAVLDSLLQFPQKLFVFSAGLADEQRYVWVLVLICIVIACCSLRREEARGPLGGLTLAAALAFIGYLLIPDLGFGGSVVKTRFAWAVFLLGGLVLCSAQKFRMIRVTAAFLVGLSLLAQLTVVARQARTSSDAVAEYLAATDPLPEGAHFVRMNFAAPMAMARLSIDHLAFNPLLHLASLGAVRRHAVDLSDYQSATGTFSVQLKPSIDPGKQATLWAFESAGADAWISLEWLRKNMPVAIDYVLLVDDQSPGSGAPAMQQAGVNTGTPFVGLYKLAALPAEN